MGAGGEADGIVGVGDIDLGEKWMSTNKLGFTQVAPQYFEFLGDQNCRHVGDICWWVLEPKLQAKLMHLWRVLGLGH